MTIPKLPSRYEDLDSAFRGRLRADSDLLSRVQQAHTQMQISGGVRFLPIFGRSGSGKSSAAREIATHLPECRVVELSRKGMQSEAALLEEIRAAKASDTDKLVVAIVDQYEENVAQAENLPTQFVERIALLDRNKKAPGPVLFIWLTTSKEFQTQLSQATSRNERILLQADYEIEGPARDDWADIVEETFEFHNQEQPLADFGLLRGDIEQAADLADTLGLTIEAVGERLGTYAPQMQDLSKHQVLMLWPVTDGLRITRVSGFTNQRDGYRLDWNAFYRDLPELDRRNVQTMSAYNRARLYFDVRLVPIAAADLHKLCLSLDVAEPNIAQSYLDKFKRTHLYSLSSGAWDPTTFAPLRERESQRSQDAMTWYETVTSQPVAIGKRLAYVFRQMGHDARAEENLNSPYRNVRTDLLVLRPESQQSNVCIEIKAFSAEGTRPSSIRDAIRGTLRKYAQFAGFIEGD